jgi:hypothetical protein
LTGRGALVILASGTARKAPAEEEVRCQQRSPRAAH